MPDLHPPSPCIRNCCLNERDICVGCLRTIDEITGWSASSAEQQRAVLKRCEERARLANSGTKADSNLEK
jgi:predicted Fe-S protein YdhL (DUF1289 family)